MPASCISDVYLSRWWWETGGYCRVAAAALIAPSTSFSYASNLWNAKEAITAICSRAVRAVAMCQSGDFSATSTALRGPDQWVDLGHSNAHSQRLWASEIILPAVLTTHHTSPKLQLCFILSVVWESNNGDGNMHFYASALVTAIVDGNMF